MAELKTRATTQNPKEFLATLTPDSKQKDAFVLLDLFQKITREKAVMWGTAIVGFGKYHYKSERSSQEGDWPLIGFAPRKQNISIYLMGTFQKQTDLLAKLGKHKTGMGCLYINKLADVDMKILATLIEISFRENKKLFLKA